MRSGFFTCGEVAFSSVMCLYFCLDKAIGTVADKVGTFCFYQSFTHEVCILRQVPLKQCPLKLFFMTVSDDVYHIPRKGVYAGVIHNR